MDTFFAGEQKTATVVMTNPTSSLFDYEATLFIGISALTSSVQSFQLAAGEARSISFPIAMPPIAGTYPVYISVESGGVTIALYQSTEDIQVVAPPVTIMLKNPPYGANRWGISLYDWSAQEVLGLTIDSVYDSALFSIPASWAYPLRFYISIIKYNGGVTVLHTAQSWSDEWGNYVAEFISAPGVYYYNVTTGKFELLG